MPANARANRARHVDEASKALLLRCQSAIKTTRRNTPDPTTFRTSEARGSYRLPFSNMRRSAFYPGRQRKIL